MIQMSVMNQSTVTSDAEVQSWLPAFESQWNNDLIPIWPLEPVKFTFIPNGQTPPPQSWWAVFLDDSTQAGALAFHDLTDDGFPIAKVFCKTILDDHSSITVGASHEFLEMAVDPWLNMAFQDNTGKMWAGEIADPCEDDQYAYKIDGVLVSDFATPAWFGHANTPVGAPMDLKGHMTTPFSILTGGYAQWFDPAQGWQQMLGSKAKKHGRLVHAPKGSRRERRGRHLMRSAFLAKP